jgi:hypothetical protein
MTNDEIYKWVREFVDDPNFSLCNNCHNADYGRAELRIRALLARAYEEAASVAENVGVHWAEESGEYVEIAARLRRMKDSLEPVSS